jgi:DNA-binding transcriptional ArsR family regulator
VADRCEVLCLDLPRAEALRRGRADRTATAEAAGRARALGDPTRFEVASALLAGGELCVCDLGWIIERSDALVSHHLRLLRAAGLVASRRDGKMVMYRLTDQGAELLSTLLPPVAVTST